MSSTSLTKSRERAGKSQVSLRRNWPNTMNFPQALRDAIPSLPQYWGRSLILASVDGRCGKVRGFGKRVRLKFRVEESGKLSGKFDVWIDMDAEAARGMATLLGKLMDEGEEPPAASQ